MAPVHCVPTESENMKLIPAKNSNKDVNPFVWKRWTSYSHAQYKDRPLSYRLFGLSYVEHYSGIYSPYYMLEYNSVQICP